MKEHGTGQLFETVRQAPTELSKQQVMDMINILPTLPPPGNSWFNINLNSIIMTTTVVAIISSAVIYLTTPTTLSDLPNQEVENQASTLIQAPDEIKESTITPIDTVEPIAIIPEPNTKPLDLTLNPGPLSIDESSPNPIGKRQDLPPNGYAEQRDTALSSKSTVNLFQPAQSEGNSGQPLFTSYSSEEAKAYSIPTETKRLKTLPLKKLKKSLLKELLKDKLISSKRNFNLLEYKESEIFVNSNRFDYQAFAKYNALLNRYSVTAGPNKKVALDPKFIMVGNFTEAGFDGSALGRSMEIDFVSKGTFFNASHIGKPLNVVFLKNPNAQNQNSPFNQTDDGTTETRSVASFDRIRVSGLAVVHYTQGPEKSLRLNVSGMPIEDVRTEVIDGELLVYTTQGKTFNGESIKVYVSSPHIESVTVDGSAEFIAQNPISVDALKVSAFGSGSAELTVDVDRLHLIMDGGDIEVEGKTTMERTDFLKGANDGTLEQSNLRVLKNWVPDENSATTADDLTNLKEALTKKLFADGFIESWRDELTISFSRDGLTIGKSSLSADELASYIELLKTYKFDLRGERKLFLSHDFIVIADRNNGIFEFEMRGTDLNFKAQNTWQELEDDVFDRQ